MDIFTVIFSDLMVWSSIPMVVGAGIWETHLDLSVTSHTLLRIGILLLLLAWIRFWFSISEVQRLRNLMGSPAASQHDSPSTLPISQPVDNNLFIIPCSDAPEKADETGNKIDQRTYVTNH